MKSPLAITIASPVWRCKFGLSNCIIAPLFLNYIHIDLGLKRRKEAVGCFGQLFVFCSLYSLVALNIFISYKAALTIIVSNIGYQQVVIFLSFDECRNIRAVIQYFVRPFLLSFNHTSTVINISINVIIILYCVFPNSVDTQKCCEY